ncbi:MAG TPA: hypothetical protein ENI23_13230, partial [bacterium]|nr:hypothetical protein [bacterium]
MKNNFTIEDVKEHWDSVAHIYNHCNDKSTNPHHWRFIEGIKHIDKDSKPKNVLSIVSRTGDAIPHIYSKLPNARIFNFEFSQKMIDIAEYRFPKEKFYMCDLSTLELKDNSMDYI